MQTRNVTLFSRVGSSTGTSIFKACGRSVFKLEYVPWSYFDQAEGGRVLAVITHADQMGKTKKQSGRAED